MLGLAAGPLAFVALMEALFGVYERQSALQFLLTFPENVPWSSRSASC